MTDQPKATDALTKPAPEVRIMRLFVVIVLIGAAIWTLRRLLDNPILEGNKLEVGLLLGWLIAKSGTVIDWLFGGSESGNRRADLNAHQAAMAGPLVPQKEIPKDAAEGARQAADAADGAAEEIERQAGGG